MSDIGYTPVHHHYVHYEFVFHTVKREDTESVAIKCSQRELHPCMVCYPCVAGLPRVPNPPAK